MPRMERQLQDVQRSFERAKEDARRNPVNARSAGRLVEERRNYLDRLSRELDEAGQTNTEKSVFERPTGRPLRK